MASDKTKMDRQKSKFIYDFLPNNTFNHAHSEVVGQVRQVYSERDEETGMPVDADLPERYVMRRIYRHLSKWPNSDALHEDLDAEIVEFVVPGRVKYNLFPKQFECSGCGSVNTFDYEGDVKEMEKSYVDAADIAVCAHCDDPLADRDQLPLIGVCECGASTEPYVPQCCGAGMQFHRETTQPSNWYWRCANTGCTNGDGGGRDSLTYMATNTYCPACDNEDVNVLNHTDNSAFYAQVERLINVKPARSRQQDLDDIHSNDSWTRAKITSDYLLHGTDAGVPSKSEVQQAAADILGGYEDYVKADDEETEEVEEQAKETLMQDADEHRRDTQRHLETSYEFDDKRLAEELYEYLSIVEADGYMPRGGLVSTSYGDMEANGADDTHLSMPKVRNYIDLRDGLNFAEIRLIKNFPITTITYGYTRIDAEPPGEGRVPGESNAEQDGQNADVPDVGEDENGDEDEEREVELNLFRDLQNYSVPQFYCQTNDAEAVFVRLDRGKALDWLEENGAVSASQTPDHDDEEAVRQWFIDNVRKPGRYESLQNDAPNGSHEKISRHCHSLVNTTAHLFINAMGALAGHQRESLVEHLMPRTMSFVVYKRPDTSFALGSLFTLYEERFEDFVSHLDELDDCSYDPVCRHDENGACEDCLYLAAISTENVNKNLGRSTFYGGRFDGDHLTGFRDI